MGICNRTLDHKDRNPTHRTQYLEHNENSQTTDSKLLVLEELLKFLTLSSLLLFASLPHSSFLVCRWVSSGPHVCMTENKTTNNSTLTFLIPKKSYPFWVAILIFLAKDHSWPRFVQMPNNRPAVSRRSCLLYQSNKILNCQSFRFYFLSHTFILPPIGQRNLEALAFFYKESKKKKMHVLSFVGLVWLVVVGFVFWVFFNAS